MVKVGYVLCADKNNGSTRISSLNMFPFLKQADYQPVVIHQSGHYQTKPNLDLLVETAASLGFKQGDIIYFQKVHGSSAVKAANSLKERGIKTVFGICDYVDPEMAKCCDAVVVPSEPWKEIYAKSNNKSFVVHDGIESPDRFKTVYSQQVATKYQPLEVVLLTSQRMQQVPLLTYLPYYVRLTVIGDYSPLVDSPGKIKNDGFNFIKRLSVWRAISPTARTAGLAARMLKNKLRDGRNTSSESSSRISFKTLPWSLETIYQQLPCFDAAIIPIEFNLPVDLKTVPEDLTYAKSANRLTQLMAAGLAVIASPLPSYLPIINTGQNGFIAYSLTDWAAFFKELKDPTARESIGHAARESVIETFSQEEQARRLIKVFQAIA